MLIDETLCWTRSTFMRVCFNLQNIRFCGFYSFHVARLQLLYLDCPTQLFPGQLHTLHDISFEILIGCVWQIIGENSEILFVFTHVNFVVCVHPNQIPLRKCKKPEQSSGRQGELNCHCEDPLEFVFKSGINISISYLSPIYIFRGR